MNFTYSPAVLENWVFRKETVVMILESVFDPFVQNRLVCVLARGILERLNDSDPIFHSLRRRCNSYFIVRQNNQVGIATKLRCAV